MSVLRFLRIARQRLRAIARRAALETELDRELAFHLEALTNEYIASGLSPADARHTARRELGNLPLVAEQCRDQRRTSWLHDFRRDVVHGLRILVRNPTASFVIVASLGLGIGTNTALLGAIDSVGRAQVLFPDPDRVVIARTYHEDRPAQQVLATMADYLAWADQQQSFESVGLSLGNQAEVGGEPGLPAERISGVAVTAEFFSVLGVRPVLGAVYTDAEARRASPAVPVVLSHRLWQRRFGGSAGVVGARFRMNNRDAYVAGVMPERFRFPSEVVEYWVPLLVNRADVQSPQRLFFVAARLKEGVSPAQAESDLDRITTRLGRERPDRHGGWHARL